jgi:membrane dipeptidase
MKRPFICDTHADTLMRMIDLGYALDDKHLQVNINKMRHGGHDLQIFAVFIDPLVGKERYISRTLQMIDLLRCSVQKHARHIALCQVSADVRKARRDGKKIAMMGIEGGHAIANDLAILRAYRELGVIYMTLTWSNNNDWADSSGDVERWGGLTALGREVVREMNRIGMMVDISHVSDKTFWHALATSTKPLIASHSSVRSLCKHPRNMTDRMIKALAKKGGVIFINFYPAFIHQEFRIAYDKLNHKLDKKLDAIIHKWQKRRKPEMANYDGEELLQANSSSLPEVRMSDIVRHIKHVAKIAGVEAVGLGSDYDGTTFMPIDAADCTTLPRLCEALRKSGFTSREVDLIAGGNFIRVLADTVG